MTVADRTDNGYTLTSQTGVWNFSMTPFEYRYLDNTTRNTLQCFDNALFLPAGEHASLFQGDHEFHIVVNGRTFSNSYLFGVNVGSQVYYCYIDNSGKLNYVFRFGASATTFRSTNSVIRGTGSDARRVYPKIHLRHQIDFTNDTFRVWVNNGEVSMTLVSGLAISSWSPTYYNDTNAFAIGSYNNNNSASVGQATYYRTIFYAAVTNIHTDNQAYMISKRLLRA